MKSEHFIIIALLILLILLQLRSNYGVEIPAETNAVNNATMGFYEPTSLYPTYSDSS
jgi:hypothetical protein